MTKLRASSDMADSARMQIARLNRADPNYISALQIVHTCPHGLTIRAAPATQPLENEFARSPLGFIYLTYLEGVQLLRGSRAYRMVTMDRFDTELFIDEVEKRPALWNIQCAEGLSPYANNGTPHVHPRLSEHLRLEPRDLHPRGILHV